MHGFTHGLIVLEAMFRSARDLTFDLKHGELVIESVCLFSRLRWRLHVSKSLIAVMCSGDSQTAVCLWMRGVFRPVDGLPKDCPLFV